MEKYGKIGWLLGSGLLFLLIGAAIFWGVRTGGQGGFTSPRTEVAAASGSNTPAPDPSALENRPRLATAVSTRRVRLRASPTTIAPVGTPTTMPATVPTTVPGATATREPLVIPRLGIELPQLDDATEIEIGQEVARELEAEYGLYNNAAAQQRVEAIGQRIVPLSDRPELTYHFALLDTDEVNAFAVPGGFIYVTRGMLDVADSAADDELAGVVGHEIAHVARRHGAKQIERVTLAMAALEAIAARNQDWERFYETRRGQIAQQLVSELLLRGWSRNQEFDADHYGTLYMMAAGYDPYAILAFFERMQQLFQPGDPGRAERLLSTHPPFDERIERVEAVILENE